MYRSQHFPTASIHNTYPNIIICLHFIDLSYVKGYQCLVCCTTLVSAMSSCQLQSADLELLWSLQKLCYFTSLHYYCLSPFPTKPSPSIWSGHQDVLHIRGHLPSLAHTWHASDVTVQGWREDRYAHCGPEDSIMSSIGPRNAPLSALFTYLTYTTLTICSPGIL